MRSPLEARLDAVQRCELQAFVGMLQFFARKLEVDPEDRADWQRFHQELAMSDCMSILLGEHGDDEPPAEEVIRRVHSWAEHAIEVSAHR